MTITEDCVPSTKRVHVQIGWEDGGQSVTYLDHSGQHCFEIQETNRILYSYSLSLKAQTPSGNPFDLLKDAITTIKNFGTGTSNTPTPSPAQCSAVNLDDLAAKAALLQQSLTAMQPSKDSNGKTASVPVEQTIDAWEPIPQQFKDLQDGVSRLIIEMGNDSTLTGCDDVFAQAESIILDEYLTARDQYLKLASLVNSRHVVYYSAGIDNTNGYDLVVAEYYGAQQTSTALKTYHFDPAYSSLTSSAGFLLTELPASSYRSATAPNPSSPGTTQNVLAVDDGSGPRPALVVLLNANPRYVNWRHFGVGLSGGPVFDISNGKADTSRFGFFGGVSLRLTQWLYLTPGVHVGEYAGFPQGFTAAGQVIPPNTGTPVANKHYTARFAFAFTFKLKDIGSATTTTQSNATTTSSKKTGS